LGPSRVSKTKRHPVVLSREILKKNPPPGKEKNKTPTPPPPTVFHLLVPKPPHRGGTCGGCVGERFSPLFWGLGPKKQTLPPQKNCARGVGPTFFFSCGTVCSFLHLFPSAFLLLPNQQKKTKKKGSVFGYIIFPVFRPAVTPWGLFFQNNHLLGGFLGKVGPTPRLLFSGLFGFVFFFSPIF